jgi:hypothetical protein
MWSRVKGRTKNAILALPFKPRTRTHPVARQDEHVRRPGSDESWRETTYEMRLRFEAIPFRREMMINTITTNRTPETTRIIVGSIEAHSLHVHGTRYGCRSASPQHLGSKEVERQFWIQDHV